MSNENEIQKEENIESSKDETIASLKDKLLRMAADMENLRKRSAKELKDGIDYANTKLATSLIDVVENFILCCNKAPIDKIQADTEVANFYTGIEMTRDSLLRALEQNKIFRYEPEVGELFDHNVHQAISQIQNPELEDGTIADSFQAGYNLGDRVLKHAMVVIVKNN